MSEHLGEQAHRDARTILARLRHELEDLGLDVDDDEVDYDCVTAALVRADLAGVHVGVVEVQARAIKLGFDLELDVELIEL